MIGFSLTKKSHALLMSVLTALLLFAGWPAAGFAPLLLLAWVPLLALEDYYFENRKTVKHKAVFFFSYLCFFLWNVLDTWWIYFATTFGMAAAIIFNSLFMATVFALFHFARCRLGSRAGYAVLVVYWIAFEYLHLNWDLSWPWLTLGNGFAAYPRLVQWYEFTGVLGGSAWILVCNILIYSCLKLMYAAGKPVNKLWMTVSFTAAVILVPVVISEIRYFTYEEKQNPVDIAVVQPNIDPYTEKFSSMSGREQVEKLLKLAATVTDSSTDYLIGPETSLPYSIWENDLAAHPDVRTLKKFLQNYPQLELVTGVSTNRFYETKPASLTARKFPDSPEYYDSYNTAIQLDHEGDIQIYHKSKLVIGVEKIPYPAVFGYFEKFAIDLGGAAGSLGTQEEPSVFESPKQMKIAPAICYESIYGEYMAEYIRKGAMLIFIITNDGWWGDTPGYRQHLQYARLRAIENRRSIARSANTGISGFINQRGDLLQLTSWWVPAAIRQKINANDTKTFYSVYGDYPGKIASCLACLFLVLSVVGPFIFRGKIDN